MRTFLAGVCALFLTCSAAFTQDVPKFSSVQVRTSKPGTTDGGGYMESGNVEFFGGTLLDIISQAYGLEPSQIIGGPNWLDTDRFDIVAKADRTTPAVTLQSMMQALLADRFKLAVRKEEKPLPVFVLTVSKHGLKMKQAKEEGPSDCQGKNDAGNTVRTCKNMTMAEIAQSVRGAAPAYLNHPVVDRTGLTAKYDFTITWTARGQLRRTEDGDTQTISFFDAAEKLGLHFEQQDQPMPVVVIEKVERTPTVDPNEKTRTAPAEPTQFEVASLKPTPPDTKGMKMNITPGGQVELLDLAVADLVKLAYSLDEREEIANMPKWMETDKYDIIAKTIPNVSFTAAQTMLKNLLAERFGLKVHTENQPVQVFAFTLAKRTAKLKDSDGTARSECTPGALDGRRILTCQNVTMEQATAKIHQSAGAYFVHPAVDLTGLKGTYDFALSWSPARRFGRGGDAGAAAGNPSDPTGDITVFEALEKQLGIKVIQQKYPIPTLTIDNVNRTPTEN